MIYRTPAPRKKIWHAKEGNWKNWICAALGHKEHLWHTERYKVEPPEVKNEPKPKGRAIPQKIILHWISEIEHQVFYCERCDKQWDKQNCYRSGNPIEYTQWITF